MAGMSDGGPGGGRGCQGGPVVRCPPAARDNLNPPRPRAEGVRRLWPLVGAVLADLGAGIGLAAGAAIALGSCARPCTDPEAICPAVCVNWWAMFPSTFVAGALYALLPAAAVGLGLALIARAKGAGRAGDVSDLLALPTAIGGVLGTALLLGLVSPQLPASVRILAIAIGCAFVLGAGVPLLWLWRSPTPDLPER